MANDESTRDRVRALVRDVLANALPAEDEGPAIETSGAAPASELDQSRASGVSSRFINTAPVESAASVPEYARDESSKMVITEDDVRGLEEGARLRIAEGARLTPLAADLVRERKIELVRRVPRRGSRAMKMVAVGADHGGYRMKEELKTLLAEMGHRVHDFGTDSEDAVDYPDFAHAVARAVSEGTADVGIIIDGAGVGSCMTANKVPGVRAAACYSVAVAKNSREHNDANVLTLGSKTINNALMREIVGAWLATEMTEERHRKRVAKIEAIERQYKC
ncbi:MAG: ribose 5-phosphate isomerase [Blastocatellia bacterium]|jgi:ribose 5-phosphate isomerase B|nr:ribose 5-phosphate isomerase [Blastocatellia bacterium]